MADHRPLPMLATAETGKGPARTILASTSRDALTRSRQTTGLISKFSGQLRWTIVAAGKLAPAALQMPKHAANWAYGGLHGRLL